jgi:hypothetical protein
LCKFALSNGFVRHQFIQHIKPTIMKILKIVSMVLGGVLVLYVLTCLIGPRNLDTTVTRQMAVPAELAYAQVVELRNWSNWSPWYAQDPDMKLQFGEPSAGVGANYSWESATMGNGNLEIMEAVQSREIRTRIQFTDWEGYSYGHWQFEDQDNGKSQVSWGMKGDSDLPFLMRGMMWLMRFEKSIRNDFETGLEALEAHVLSQQG